MGNFAEFRRKKRMSILKLMFVLILCGFFCAYQGGVSSNSTLIAASFAIFAVSIAGILLVKK